MPKTSILRSTAGEYTWASLRQRCVVKNVENICDCYLRCFVVASFGVFFSRKYVSGAFVSLLLFGFLLLLTYIRG